MTRFLSYLTIFVRKNLHIWIFFCTFAADFKTISIMTEKTISSYTGYGHRVQLVQRRAVGNYYSVVNNRKVLISTGSLSTAKDVFLNHVAGIVRQTQMTFGI